MLTTLLVLTMQASMPCAPGTPSIAARVDGWTVSLSWRAAFATRYDLSAGTAPGATDALHEYTLSQHYVTVAPAGTYYVRVRGVDCGTSGPVSSELVLPVPCLLNAPVLTSPSVSRLTWTLPTAVDPEGYRLEIATTPHAPDVLGLSVGHGTQAGFSGFGAGVYYARLRSVSQCGGMLVSNEQAFWSR